MLNRIVGKSLRARLPFSFPFFSDHKNNEYGVMFDEERIKQKMKELKEREGGEGKKTKSVSEFMKDYRIIKEKPKVLKFREQTDTLNLMNIEDVSLDEKPTTLQVTSFSEQEIDVDEFSYPPSVILTPNQVLVWEIDKLSSISAEKMGIISLINPPPEYIIVGSNNPLQLKSQIQPFLRSLGISYDILEMFQAISNFNNFAANQTSVIAFLYSGE